MIVSTLERYCSLESSNFQDTILSVISKRFRARVSEAHFQTIVSRLTNDPTDRLLYQKWLKKYLENATKKKIRSLKVFTARFSYLPVWQAGLPEFHLIEKKLLFEAS